MVTLLQDECEKIKNNINAEFKDAEKYPNWKPIIFKTEKFDRRKLIAHYLAMDVGVVTPRMDGMNLVLLPFFGKFLIKNAIKKILEKLVY
jgi:trehalose-6-phosphate synthase